MARLQLRSLRRGRQGDALPIAADSPAIRHFHPTQRAHLLICGSAAEDWLVSTPDASDSLNSLHQRGIQTLLLAEDGRYCPRFRQAAADRFSGTLLTSPLGESRLACELRSAQADQTPTQTIHGVLLRIYGLGVLLSGGSGVGKSELALELVSRGHQLVADDAVELRYAGPNCVLGRCPPLLNGFIEVRGLGILDLRALYGPRTVTPQARLDLIFELSDQRGALSTRDLTDRLHGDRTLRSMQGAQLPQIPLSWRLGHNLAIVVEAGCRDHWLRLAGYHADAVFIQRQQGLIDAAGVASGPPKSL